MSEKEKETNRRQPSDTGNEKSSGDQKETSGRGEETQIYLTSDSTLQTPEEAARDKSIDPRKDDTISVSQDDLNETKADQLAGSDRAGTSERKDNTI